MFVRVCIHACTTTCMWSPKDNLQDPELPFHHGISQAIRFGSKLLGHRVYSLALNMNSLICFLKRSKNYKNI